MDNNSLADVIILLSLFQSENKVLLEELNKTLKEIRCLMDKHTED